MTTVISGNRSQNLRIIWAITMKDIGDAARNKNIMSNVLAIVFLLLFYGMTPILFKGDDPPGLAIYDAGGSDFFDELSNNPAIDLHQMSSREQMEHYLGRITSPALGLVFPSGFYQAVDDLDAPIELEGYVDHWVGSDVVAEVTTIAEREIADLVGRPVHIRVQQEAIYTQFDGGQAFIVALGQVVLLTILGLSIPPILMLEEKQNRTLDAILVSPASGGQVIISKALTGLFYCLTAAALALAFNGAVIVNWGLVISAVVCGSLFSVALGLVMGTLIQMKQQVKLWLFVLMQPLLLTVVADLMASLFPERIVAALGWMPTVAMSRVIRLSLLNKVVASQFVPELLFVLASAAVLLGIAAWRVQRSDLA